MLAKNTTAATASLHSGSATGAAVRRSFCAMKTQSDRTLSRKAWTVIGYASLPWIAAFGCAAMLLGVQANAS
jgi:hypothetical protein